MSRETPDITYLDFKILNEKWNSYKLEDGTTLKARILLVTYAKVNNPMPNQANFFFASHTTYGVEAPGEIRGPGDPNQYVLSQLLEAIEPGKEDLKFNTLQEVWSDYVIEDSTKISLKVTPTRIMRTKKFDSIGNPQYVVQSVVLPKVVAVDPKKLAAIVNFGATG